MTKKNIATIINASIGSGPVNSDSGPDAEAVWAKAWEMNTAGSLALGQWRQFVQALRSRRERQRTAHFRPAGEAPKPGEDSNIETCSNAAHSALA
jgi:hypothetical protein